MTIRSLRGHNGSARLVYFIRPMRTIKIFQGMHAHRVGGAFTLAKALAKCREWSYVAATANQRSRDGKIGYGEGSMFTYVLEADAHEIDAENKAQAPDRLKGG